MKILIACEYSGIVRNAFTLKGHDVWSCDLLPSELPGKHLQCDVLSVLENKWDMMIAHPPCTYLSYAGNGALAKNPERKLKIYEAVQFFMKLYNAPIEKVCVENPRGHITNYFRREDQVIEPFEFGHSERKRTCLWLKNLPPLIKTCLNPAGMLPKKVTKRKSGKKIGGTYSYYYVESKTAKERARFWAGIASAMADQWS